MKVTLSSTDQSFTACEPVNCGYGPNISYPFYITGKQKPFCGYPGFDLTCGKNGFPILDIINTQHIIQQIFYNNNSFRVSNPVFSTPNTSQCILPTQNLTVGKYRFRIAPNQRNLFVFYGCNLTLLPEEMKEHKIGCSVHENRTSSNLSVVALYAEDVTNVRLAEENCRGGWVNATVEDEKGGNVREALEEGFVMSWNVSNCSTCLNSGGRCGFDTSPAIYAFRCFCRDGVHVAECNLPPSPLPLPPPSQQGNGWTRQKKVIIGATAAAVIAGLLSICYFTYMLPAWQEKYCFLTKSNQDIEAFLKNYGVLTMKRYKFSDVKKMTNSFKVKLGQGGFGVVYKGKLSDGSNVAVKMLNPSKGNGKEFINEVASISRTSHVNVVTLFGFCFEGRKKVLIYEFISNGSLDKFIYRKEGVETTTLLSWDKLYQIAKGIAKGLEYLHRGCNTQILHFDIKPHNILLDENFCPKISDFGLAKLCPGKESLISMSDARGTIGYIAPEVWNRHFGKASHKSDVYSYGMMLLDIVGGKKNINVEGSQTSEIYFPDWIYKKLEQGTQLGPEDGVVAIEENELVKKMTIVGLWCIQTIPNDRPTMSKVVEMLEGSIDSIKMPPRPALSSPVRSIAKSSTLLN
ncbi:LEAF RUST 10 DISEASE-RESISTANCE LOCUS RECEPTOR-LIKE PROTEIN KINASE-like 2.7 [Arachis stenosperma]|uniref:LEAF RUST 10 DISEASE-RESISTANCE LOCUS RECEPTOR-LIKE PROTEIN KINASE-like 2.7 n=1 Tax=Arachis stenosperma TaxID=217475 RepID=UPI0025AC47F5|nr:LEAF RUST 10 DISEASE-RESISTANCE LOCUS RECEPTOR-LIKE PROTEIN KINASE-like 2.7 [Arachis stenosperma]